MCAVGSLITRAEFDRLKRELVAMRGQTPIRLQPTPLQPQAIIIIGGQTMGTFNSITYYGIEKFAGTLSGITTQTYDPGTCNSATGAETGAPSPAITAWPSGIGFGLRWDGKIYRRVIVVNDSRGGCANALLGGANDDTTYVPSVRTTTILSSKQVSVTKADASIVSGWSPDLG